MDTSLIRLRVKEKQDGENGSQASREKLNVRCLWQTEQIQKVSPAQQSKLVEESGLHTRAIAISPSVQLLASWSNFIVIVD